MDWKAIAQLVAPFAPTAGRFLGDLIPFPGASIVGGLLGEAVAAALGVPATPEDVSAAIQNMPASEVQARLASVESEAAARYDAMARIAEADAKDRTAQSTVINETVREEIAAGVSWWHWRHLGGYVVLWLALIVSAGFIKAMFWGTPSAADLGLLISAITPIFLALCALNGYVAADSTALKQTAITGQKPESVVANAVKSVLPKKR